MARSWHFGPILRAARRQRVAAGLVILQVAMGLALVVLTAMVGDYVLRISSMPSGIASDELLVVETRAAGGGAPALSATAADLEILRAIPGVADATVVDARLRTFAYRYPDRLATPDGTRTVGVWDVGGGAGLARTLGITLAEGRDFEPDEVAAAMSGGVTPAIITRSMSRQLLPGTAPLGQELVSRTHGRVRVVGIVDRLSVMLNADTTEGLSVLYGRLVPTGARTLYAVRTAKASMAGVQRAIEARLRQAAPERAVRVEPADTLKHRLDDSDRATIGIVAAVVGSLVISVLIGAFALTAFLVQERTRQIGLRRALGARKLDVIAHFLVENLIFTCAGLALGVLGLMGLTWAFGRMLPGFNIEWSFVGAASALFLVTGLVATAIPARRAAGIPPSAASKTI